MKSLIEEIRNTRDFENLKQRVGKTLGMKIIKLINVAEKADKELDIVHEALTELYNFDNAVPIIKKTLDKISKL